MVQRNFRSHHEMRRQTYLTILKALQAGITSKRGIQDHSGLSWGSCSPVINHLLSQEVIDTQEVNQPGKPSKGRKTKFFNFSRHRYLLMGMEIDMTTISCCITTLGADKLGSFIKSYVEPVNSTNIVDKIVAAFNDCCSHCQVETTSVICISFSLPGAIDVEKKQWLYSSRFPGIDGVDFSKLEGKQGLPANLYLQHDIHAQANSVIPGNELEDRDYVFIHVGEGIGMSANMGEILYGFRGFAGEIGHIPYPGQEGELLCSCGNKNCLETLLNTPRVLEFVNNKFGTDINDIDEISDQEVIRQTALAYVLPPLVFMATIVSNIFDPRRIIIGGSVIEPFYQYLIVAFEQELRQKAWFNGPAEICWYHAQDMDGSYGAVLHSGEVIVEDFLDHIDLDH